MANKNDHQTPNHHGKPQGSSSELLTRLRDAEIEVWATRMNEEQKALWKIREKKEELEVHVMELELKRVKQELALQLYLPIVLLLCVAAIVWLLFSSSTAGGVLGACVVIALLKFVLKVIELYARKSSRE